MAQIEVKTPEKDKELHFLLKGTESGQKFDFVLKRNHVLVHPKEKWESKLTEAEKNLLFNKLLAEYRKRSIGDPRIAAVGIAENGNIYIGTNTEQYSSPYFRQCAEQNMVTAVTQADIYEQIKANLASGNPHDNFKPHPPKLKAFYMMGGRQEGKTDQDGNPQNPIPLLCPCGNCTDMLAKVMTSPDAPMYLFPVNDGTALPPMDEGKANLAEVDVAGGHGWKTDIAALNYGRVINLNTQDAQRHHHGKESIKLQRSSFRELIRLGTALPQDRALPIADKLLELPVGSAEQASQGHGFMSFFNLAKFLKLEGHQSLEQLPQEMVAEAKQLIAVAVKSAENALLRRESIPELDIAAQGGQLSEPQLYHFMYEQIQQTFADRLKALQKGKAAEMSDGGLQKLVEKEVRLIRCAVIQLDDGTFRYAIESDVNGKDKAGPCAEVNAIGAAMARLGNHGVTDVWTMELNPKDIAQGVVHTSSKEAAERLVKRRSHQNQDVRFHALPFIDGALVEPEKLQKMRFDFKAIELFPSYYSGVENAAFRALVQQSEQEAGKGQQHPG